MPKNIFNFMIKYLNNILATPKNLSKWSLSDSQSCSYCLHPETLQHVVSNCRSYLEDGGTPGITILFYCSLPNHFLRYSIASSMLISLFPSPSLITGDSLLSDLALIAQDNSLYVLELTVGFETTIETNSNRKLLSIGPFCST